VDAVALGGGAACPCEAVGYRNMCDRARAVNDGVLVRGRAFERTLYATMTHIPTNPSIHSPLSRIGLDRRSRDGRRRYRRPTRIRENVECAPNAKPKPCGNEQMIGRNGNYGLAFVSYPRSCHLEAFCFVDVGVDGVYVAGNEVAARR
jgi:hypothetical protein